MLSLLFKKRPLYLGGADATDLCSVRFELEENSLELILPRSNIPDPVNSVRDVNFHFRSDGWFERKKEQAANHVHIRLYCDGWKYINPRPRAYTDPEWGIFSVFVWLKRVVGPSDRGTVDLERLGDSIRQEYVDFFESPIEGPLGKGKNHKIRQDRLAQYKRVEGFPGQKEKMDIFLKKYLSAIPENFERFTSNGNVWLRYFLEKEFNAPTEHFCLMLDDNYYIDVNFRYWVDMCPEKSRNKILENMNATRDLVMSQVRVTFPNRLGYAASEPQA